MYIYIYICPYIYILMYVFMYESKNMRIDYILNTIYIYIDKDIDMYR